MQIGAVWPGQAPLLRPKNQNRDLGTSVRAIGPSPSLSAEKERPPPNRAGQGASAMPKELKEWFGDERAGPAPSGPPCAPNPPYSRSAHAGMLRLRA